MGPATLLTHRCWVSSSRRPSLWRSHGILLIQCLGEPVAGVRHRRADQQVLLHEVWRQARIANGLEYAADRLSAAEFADDEVAG